MAGNCNCNNEAVAKEYLVTVVEHTAKRRDILVICYTKACYTLFYVLGPRPVGIVGTGFYTEYLLYECIAEYMVKMQVCVEVVLQCQAVVLNELPNLLPFLWKPCSTVNEDCFVGIVPKKIAVYLYGVYYEFLELQDVV